MGKGRPASGPPWSADASAGEQAYAGLRVLLADQEEERLAEIASVVESLGHEIVARSLDVERVGDLTRLERPDVAFVGLGESGPHALDLVSEIVDEAVCPVIVRIGREEPDFVREAARRGVFAYIVSSAGRDAMEGAIDIALRRYADYSGLQGAVQRRLLVERAKGIVIERHGLSESEAFELLRRQARSTNRRLVDVARAVLEAQPILRDRGAGRPGGGRD